MCGQAQSVGGMGLHDKVGVWVGLHDKVGVWVGLHD